MKKRYLRKFINMDDSFTGDYFNGKIIGLPFRIVTSASHGKLDTIPRIYIVYDKLDNLAKNKNTCGYLLLDSGKIKRIDIYKKSCYTEEHEKILELFTKVFYKQLMNYFFHKNGNNLLSEKEFKKYLI